MKARDSSVNGIYIYSLNNGQQSPYSLTILENIPSLVLRIFLYLEAFECNTTSDWLNHMVEPIRSCVTFKFTNFGEKDKERS